jgi:hypothetical protein
VNNRLGWILVIAAIFAAGAAGIGWYRAVARLQGLRTSELEMTAALLKDDQEFLQGCRKMRLPPITSAKKSSEHLQSAGPSLHCVVAVDRRVSYKSGDSALTTANFASHAPQTAASRSADGCPRDHHGH